MLSTFRSRIAIYLAGTPGAHGSRTVPRTIHARTAAVLNLVSPAGTLRSVGDATARGRRYMPGPP
eukprot:SAG31_NODE_2800_length_5077_cov_2.098433_7_plen_65_part_00